MVAQTHPDTQNELRQAWRDSVRIVSGRAADALGLAFHSRIAKAQDLVLRDCVAPQEGDSYTVSGDSGRDYDVTPDYECGCPDTAKAPELPDSGAIGCKHVLAVMLRKRSIQFMQARMDARPADQKPQPAADSLPEAPLSVNMRGTLRGRPNAQLTARAKTVAELARLLDQAACLFDVEPEPESQRKAVTGFGDPEAPFCTEHSQPYLRHHGQNGDAWWSHRKADGGWCRLSRKP